MLREILILVLLAGNAARDIRTLTISPALTGAAGAAGFFMNLFERRPFGEWMAASCPGWLFLALGLLGRGVGAVDGFCLLACSFFLPAGRIWGMLMAAGGVSFAAAVILAAGRAGRREFPFIPCLLAGYILERICAAL